MRRHFKSCFLILGIVFCLMLLTNQLSSAPPSDKKPESDKKEGTLQVDKPEIQSTVSQPVEEGSLESKIWGFLKILFLVVIVLGGGGLFYWMYRRYEAKKIKETQETEKYLRRMIKEEMQNTIRTEIIDYLKNNPLGKGDSFSQEIPRIYQKIEEAIERRFSPMAKEVRRLQRGLSLFQSLYRKEHSVREGFLQETDKILSGSIPYEEPEIRGKELEKPTPQIKKPLTEQHLIEWWNKFGNQLLSICKKTLSEEFSNPELEVILTRSYNKEADWQIIGIKDDTQGDFFILPRKEGLWWSDYYKQLSNYDQWFDIEEKSGSELRIKSLKTLPKAKKISNKWALITDKGKVSIKESQ